MPTAPFSDVDPLHARRRDARMIDPETALHLRMVFDRIESHAQASVAEAQVRNPRGHHLYLPEPPCHNATQSASLYVGELSSPIIADHRHLPSRWLDHHLRQTLQAAHGVQARNGPSPLASPPLPYRVRVQRHHHVPPRACH